MPVMAPHFVANGDVPSISLSITWRSEWSYRESEAHAANAALLRMGLDPKMPPRWPSYAWAKTVGWRIARKLRLVVCRLCQLASNCCKLRLCARILLIRAHMRTDGDRRTSGT